MSTPVFDTVGGDVTMRSFAVLKPGGRAAFIASGMKAPEANRSDVTSLRPAVPRDRPHMERIATLYKLSDAAEALRVSEARHFKGKLVFKVR
jgi:hypothetical protein